MASLQDIGAGTVLAHRRVKPTEGSSMNLQMDQTAARNREERRNLWNDNRLWWVNCLAIERYWFYAGQDLQVARGRRDALLSAIVESW
jgi:hypothetical protein